MKTTDKPYTIYIRSTKESIPVTKEEFDAYYRDINAYRIRQQRHGRCVCPESKRLSCDMDCYTCPFSRAGDTRSLDYVDADEEGNETSWLEQMPDETPLIEEIIADASEIESLFKRLAELMPEAVEIGRQRLTGKPDVQIAPHFGVSRQVMDYRLKKVKAILKQEFPDLF